MEEKTYNQSEAIYYKDAEKLRATLDIFDLSFSEFMEWCKKNSLFEACAYNIDIKWNR